MLNTTIYNLALSVGEKLKDSKLSEEHLIKYSDELFQINNFFNISNQESALLSVALCCDGRDVFIDISNLLDYLKCNRIDYFKIDQLLESLENKEIISVNRSGYRRKSDRVKSFEISTKVYEALYHNRNDKFIVVKKKKNFFEEIEIFLDNLKDDNIENIKIKEQCYKILDDYEDVNTVKLITSYKLDLYETILLFVLIIECISTGTNNKICLETTLSYFIGKTIQRSHLRRKINTETSKLNEKELIEICPQNYRDSVDIGLLNNAYELLVPDEYRVSLKKPFRPNMTKLIKPEAVTIKTLHYNENELPNIKQLNEILCTNRLKLIQDRLADKGLRKGVQILLYGPPGTGKTETVYQLAKLGNRMILMVEINKIKSMWVGESEKNLKKIFDEYALACKEFKETPILLFNESDALINKRISIGSSVDSMQNAMQNILLQELETFEGIFIATTNLLGNLDEAFNRRFLYKLQLNIPEFKTRKKIIKDLMPYLTNKEQEILAKDFQLSGGQLENIYRKSEMQFILNGNYPGIKEVKKMIELEALSVVNTRNIVKGFAKN
jgi:SpoVK/Ycf46/Vps4 family AAA+-type ATPase